MFWTAISSSVCEAFRIPCFLSFSRVYLLYPNSKIKLDMWGIFYFLEKVRSKFELTSLTKEQSVIRKGQTESCQCGNTRLANGPTHGEVVFLFACFMIIATFVLKVVGIRKRVAYGS